MVTPHALPDRIWTIVEDFPTGILQTIFAEACGDGYIWVYHDALDTPFHLPSNPSPTQEPFAITLLHICSRWRAIARVTRTMWERVGLVLSTAEVSEDIFWLSVRRLDRVLKYARKAPMSVKCQGALYNNHHATLCDRLFRTSNQWKHADLHLTGETTMKPILWLKGRLALLESLDLYLVLEQPTEDSDDLSLVFRRAPLRVDVTCGYSLWAYKFPWPQIQHFSGTFSRDTPFQYAMRSLERQSPHLRSMFLKAPQLFPSVDPVDFANHHRTHTSLHTLTMADAFSASRIICPPLTNLSLIQHVPGRSTYTLLTIASSLVASSRCSLTSLSINYLRPMPHELEPLRQILLRSPNMERLSILVAQREPRRINRVARLLLDFFKSCAGAMRFLRSLSIELLVRDEEVRMIPGPVPPLELDTLGLEAVLVKAYAAPPFQAHHHSIALALSSNMGRSEVISQEFITASEKTLDQILECRMYALEFALKVRQTWTGCDWWMLCVSPERSVGQSVPLVRRTLLTLT